ncbi:MAG TPA: peptide chain release factor 2 [Candidatus Dormibacteraeota bacterium]
MSELGSRAEDLHRRAVKLKEHLDFAGKQARADLLEQELGQPGAWDDPSRAQRTSQELSRLRGELGELAALEVRSHEAVELANLLEEDAAGSEEVAAEVGALAKELDRRELDLLYQDPYSDYPAILSVHAGAGGTDAQDWSEMLLRMYLRWAAEHRIETQLLDQSEGEEAGIKSATVRFSGTHAYGQLRAEKGVHRLVRISPFDAAHRRHTAFSLIETYPEIPDEVEVDLDEKDVRVDVYRSSGAGGQHVNKTSSAVRLTHIPTGIVVTCQNERSQQQNRETAWRVLRSRLLDFQRAQRLEHLADLKGDLTSPEWGNQIRSYVLQPYTLVKDNRTNLELGNVDAVLEGAIDPFIEAYLRQEATEREKDQPDS